ncbi:hypothetical protein J6590_101743 [Homalodisca vitripennis]|nr:hypothetical protein J6590_101743 [Homalodisca vitripennis]
MASVRKKGQTIHSKARDVIRRVIQKCDEESNTGTLQHRLKQSNIRVANYTGISVRSVTSIRKEGVEADWEGFTNHTLKLEQDFWIKDGLIEDVIDHFVIELGGVDSSESDDDQSSSESDLACPLD